MRCVIALIAACLIVACTGVPRETGATRTVTVIAQVPPGTGRVYLAGNLQSLGPWKADALEMSGDGAERRAIIEIPQGAGLEYKFTLGDWGREALGPSGMVMANFRLEPDASEARHEISDFKKDVSVYIASPEAGGVVGTLVYWQDVKSRFLSEPRHVSIWLPPGYDQAPDKRYRVIYMSDGQNLFDPRIANTGTDWGADEAMIGLAKKGIDPAIIVSTWSTSRRGIEYSPWHGAADYARFLIVELKPRIDLEYRTLSGPQNTFHAGSSMGGLLSFFLVTTHPDVFSACGCVSTHFPLSEDVARRFIPGLEGSVAPDTEPYILGDIASGLRPPQGARYRFDYGALGLDADYGPTHDAVAAWLIGNGKVEGEDFEMRAHPAGDHNEASWRAQLPDIFAFLLSPPEPAHP